jgi:hypothetical protein
MQISDPVFLLDLDRGKFFQEGQGFGVAVDRKGQAMDDITTQGFFTPRREFGHS